MPFFFPGCPLHYKNILSPTECMWILIANDRVGDRPIALSCMDIAQPLIGCDLCSGALCWQYVLQKIIWCPKFTAIYECSI